MGRRKRQEIIDELNARGVEFDPDAMYWDLWKLLTKPVQSPAEVIESASSQFPAELVERARKIGMSPEMIATFPDETSLKNGCDRISPQTNPDYRPKQGVVPKTVTMPDIMPDKFEFESRLECKFMMRDRRQFDESNLQAELRRINRKYGAQKPVKIVKTVTFDRRRGVNDDRIAADFFVTHFEIFMKG